MSSLKPFVCLLCLMCLSQAFPLLEESDGIVYDSYASTPCPLDKSINEENILTNYLCEEEQYGNIMCSCNSCPNCPEYKATADQDEDHEELVASNFQNERSAGTPPSTAVPAKSTAPPRKIVSTPRWLSSNQGNHANHNPPHSGRDGEHLSLPLKRLANHTHSNNNFIRFG